MRNLTEVIDQMVTHLPKTEDELRLDLLDRKCSCMYTAPEAWYVRWEEVADILHHRFGEKEPTEGWEKKVVDIWMDRK